MIIYKHALLNLTTAKLDVGYLAYIYAYLALEVYLLRVSKNMCASI